MGLPTSQRGDTTRLRRRAFIKTTLDLHRVALRGMRQSVYGGLAVWHYCFGVAGGSMGSRCPV
jgi:hypothetical protein